MKINQLLQQNSNQISLNTDQQTFPSEINKQPTHPSNTCTISVSPPTGIQTDRCWNRNYQTNDSRNLHRYQSQRTRDFKITSCHTQIQKQKIISFKEEIQRKLSKQFQEMGKLRSEISSQKIKMKTFHYTEGQMQTTMKIGINFKKPKINESQNAQQQQKSHQNSIINDQQNNNSSNQNLNIDIQDPNVNISVNIRSEINRKGTSSISITQSRRDLETIPNQKQNYKIIQHLKQTFQQPHHNKCKSNPIFQKNQDNQILQFFEKPIVQSNAQSQASNRLIEKIEQKIVKDKEVLSIQINQQQDQIPLNAQDPFQLNSPHFVNHNHAQSVILPISPVPKIIPNLEQRKSTLQIQEEDFKSTPKLQKSGLSFLSIVKMAKLKQLGLDVSPVIQKQKPSDDNSFLLASKQFIHVRRRKFKYFKHYKAINFQIKSNIQETQFIKNSNAFFRKIIQFCHYIYTNTKKVFNIVMNTNQDQRPKNRISFLNTQESIIQDLDKDFYVQLNHQFPDPSKQSKNILLDHDLDEKLDQITSQKQQQVRAENEEVLQISPQIETQEHFFHSLKNIQGNDEIKETDLEIENEKDNLNNEHELKKDVVEKKRNDLLKNMLKPLFNIKKKFELTSLTGLSKISTKESQNFKQKKATRYTKLYIQQKLYMLYELISQYISFFIHHENIKLISHNEKWKLYHFKPYELEVTLNLEYEYLDNSRIIVHSNRRMSSKQSTEYFNDLDQYFEDDQIQETLNSPILEYYQTQIKINTLCSTRIMSLVNELKESTKNEMLSEYVDFSIDETLYQNIFLKNGLDLKITAIMKLQKQISSNEKQNIINYFIKFYQNIIKEEFEDVQHVSYPEYHSKQPKIIMESIQSLPNRHQIYIQNHFNNDNLFSKTSNLFLNSATKGNYSKLLTRQITKNFQEFNEKFAFNSNDVEKIKVFQQDFHSKLLNTQSMKRNSFAIRTRQNIEEKRKNMTPIQQMIDVIRFGNGMDFKDILQYHKNTNIDEIDNEGYTMLMIACQEGNLQAARELISLGADLNKQNNFGETALHLAGVSRNFEMVDLLHDAGINQKLVTREGKTLWQMFC